MQKEDKTPEGNITGTADTLPVEAQLKMIREVLPDATKIGILYTTSEANSLSTIETYKELADDYGFEIVESGINTLADVDMAAADLAAKGRLHFQPDRQYRSTGSADRSGKSERSGHPGIWF